MKLLTISKNLSQIANQLALLQHFISSKFGSDWVTEFEEFCDGHINNHLQVEYENCNQGSVELLQEVGTEENLIISGSVPFPSSEYQNCADDDLITPVILRSGTVRNPSDRSKPIEYINIARETVGTASDPLSSFSPPCINHYEIDQKAHPGLHVDFEDVEPFQNDEGAFPIAFQAKAKFNVQTDGSDQQIPIPSGSKVTVGRTFLKSSQNLKGEFNLEIPIVSRLITARRRRTKKFKNKTNASIRKSKETEVESKRKMRQPSAFKCIKCRMCFTCLGSLKRHMRNKTACISQWKCQVCERVFSLKVYLLNHMRCHKNETERTFTSPVSPREKFRRPKK